MTHLNAFRYDNSRWTDAHAEYVKDEIKAYLPETEVIIPHYGEIYDFFCNKVKKQTQKVS